MTQTRMLGVVLWSDAEASKAVIWCEDHGDLAFYTPARGNGATEGAALDPGDLVQFELDEEDDLRFARNPRVLGEDRYSDLPAAVASRGAARTAPPANSANVIAFPARRRA